MKSFFKNFLLAVISVIMISACQNEINSSWITADHADCNEYNTWIEFNKDFDLKRVPGKVEMKLAADSKYWLWINDRMVIFEGGLKRGPDPQSSYYDVVDVADFLKKGKNNIRILLWHFGKDGFSHKDSGKSGLIVEAQKIGLASDSSW